MESMSQFASKEDLYKAKSERLEKENKKMHDTLLAVYHHLDVKYLDWCKDIIEKTIEIH